MLQLERNLDETLPIGLKKDNNSTYKSRFIKGYCHVHNIHIIQDSHFVKSGYQQELVLQLPGNSIKDYDALIELENSIIAGLGNLGKVDGHDMGVGEMNIFVRTDHPKAAFEKIKSVLGTRDFMPDLKAAFRDVGKDNFTVIYPEDLSHFAIA